MTPKASRLGLAHTLASLYAGSHAEPLEAAKFAVVAQHVMDREEPLREEIDMLRRKNELLAAVNDALRGEATRHDR